MLQRGTSPAAGWRATRPPRAEHRRVATGTRASRWGAACGDCGGSIAW